MAKTKRVLNGKVDYTATSPREGIEETLGKWTALHQCVREGRPEMMKIIVENGANVEIKDVDGATPVFVRAAE